ETLTCYSVDSHLLIHSIQSFQSLAGVSQPNVLDELPVSQSSSVVDDLELERAGVDTGIDADDELGVAIAHAVMDGVLDYGLQQHPRHQDSHRRRLDSFFHDQSRAEARGLDVDIDVEELELAAERDFMGRGIAQRFAQKVTEPRQCPSRQRYVATHQARDSVQGIEQKMRL